jgi:hypothetical protein
MLERIFLQKIIEHVEQSPNFNRAQSAYRRGHSTETALLRLLNDVYIAADEGSRSLLVLLDLFAAFDCIDINTLGRRLEHTFGFTGTTLSWLRSYMNGRSQFVRVGDEKSSTTVCCFGVPQGSVLGPLLFSLYVSPIANLISGFGVNHVQYADDTQLYVLLRNEGDIQTVNDCFRALHSWFVINGLSLNPNKSEATILGTSARQRREVCISQITLNDAHIPVATSVKSLDVVIDNTLSLNHNVSM